MPTFVNRALSYSRLLIFGAIILLLDQISKYWVIQNIEYGTYHFPPPIPVIDGFFYLVHIGNKGAAWGMFHGYQLQLAIFALVSIACIYLFRKALLLHKANMQIVFGLIIGGIIGNFWDRIAHGHVVDFLDVHLPFYRWPAFNIADSAICVGVFLFALFSFIPEKKKQKLDQSAEAVPESKID
jgi:signal peptidase II